MKKCLNLGHRGFSGNYPENSPIAFQALTEIDGCDGFETDVHLTADNQPVIIHDNELDRTTNGTGLVRDYTWKELQQFDCGSWFDPKFSDQRIMHFSDLMDFVLEHDYLLNLEIKNYDIVYDGIEQIVIDIIREKKAENHVFLSSFNHLSIMKCKEIAPDISAGFLYVNSHVFPERYAESNGVNAIHPRYHGLFYDQAIVTRAHEKGISVNTWTVNTPEEMQACLDLGVDAIITNFPDRLAQIMKADAEKES